MKKQKIKGYVIEASLIVFSVLLALFINKSYEAYQMKQERTKAKASIVAEMQSNREILLRLRESHMRIVSRIDSISALSNDSIESILLSEGHFNIPVLTGGESIMNEIVSSTAWETARATGIIGEFDYEAVERLTNVYWLQDVLVHKTLDKVVTVIFERETHDSHRVDITLFQFKLLFNEAVGQENFLIEQYNQYLREWQ